MTSLANTRVHTAPRRRRPISLVARIRTWSDRREQRQRLKAMPDHLLADIGVNRAAANVEARKPFWQH